jgi:hypothetical protein
MAAVAAMEEEVAIKAFLFQQMTSQRIGHPMEEVEEAGQN